MINFHDGWVNRAKWWGSGNDSNKTESTERENKTETKKERKREREEERRSGQQ